MEEKQIKEIIENKTVDYYSMQRQYGVMTDNPSQPFEKIFVPFSELDEIPEVTYQTYTDSYAGMTSFGEEIIKTDVINVEAADLSDPRSIIYDEYETLEDIKINDSV